MKNTKFLGFAAFVAAIVFTVSACASMTLVSVESDTVTGPDKVKQGQSINPKDITVWGEYKDGSRKTVSISQSSITFDNTRVGRQKVNVRTSVGVVSFDTEVMALTGITITSQPTKTIFKIGEERNASWPGLTIQATWNQMGSEAVPVSSCQITGYNKDTAGRQAVTVAYSGKTATFNVEVLGLSSIELDKPPNNVDYVAGEPINLAGIVLYANYGTNPSTRIRELVPANQLTVSGYDTNRVGKQQKVTVTFREQSVNIFVNVAEAPKLVKGTWLAATQDVFSGSNTFQAITYGNNRFVAAGGLKMITSTDCITWTGVNVSSIFSGDDQIIALAAGNGKFIAGSYKGKLAVSSNGTSWTAVDVSSVLSGGISSVTFGGGKFLVKSYGGGIYGTVAASTDGVTWTKVTGNPYMSKIKYMNNRFVGWGNDVFISTDGTTWSYTPAAEKKDVLGEVSKDFTNINSIAYGNGVYVAAANDENIMAVSTDGTAWTRIQSPMVGVQEIVFANNKFIAVGVGTGAKDNSSGVIATSTNGRNWTVVTQNVFNQQFLYPWVIAYGNGIFVAGGTGSRIACLLDN